MDIRTQPASRPAFLTADRLTGLSDTVFGVAMTLLATTLVLKAPVGSDTALDILLDSRRSLWAVFLSFAISCTYWVSQQRRLAAVRTISPHQLRLHLIFLFLIVLLPISNSLLARGGMVRSVVTIYGAHLVLIGTANLLLWTDIHRQTAAHAAVLGSCLVLGLFAAGLAAGTQWPATAQYFWMIAFAVPPITRWADRRH